jgi:hypothetical protein
MALNGSRQAIIDHRRRQVANLRLRGATQREIVEALEEQENINPSTGKAWSLGIINSDIKALDKEWKEAALRDVSEHKAQVLAELREVRRVAWGKDKEDLSIILRSLKQESELLGLDEPHGVDLTSGGQSLSEAYVKALQKVYDSRNTD